MKLYTREQVANVLENAKIEDFQIGLILDSMKPIELPSDEEIKEAAPYVPQDASMDFWANQEGFIDGAKWMKEQILNQNK